MWRRGTSEAGGLCTLCSSAVSMLSAGSRIDEESLCGHRKNERQNAHPTTGGKPCLEIMCLTSRRPERWEQDWQRGSRRPPACRSVWSCPSPHTPANDTHLLASVLHSESLPTMAASPLKSPLRTNDWSEINHPQITLKNPGYSKMRP